MRRAESGIRSQTPVVVPAAKSQSLNITDPWSGRLAVRPAAARLEPGLVRVRAFALERHDLFSGGAFETGVGPEAPFELLDRDTTRSGSQFEHGLDGRP